MSSYELRIALKAAGESRHVQKQLDKFKLWALGFFFSLMSLLPKLTVVDEDTLSMSCKIKKEMQLLFK